MTEIAVASRTPWWPRLRAVWAGAHEPVDGVPRWARVSALLVPLLVLPSSLWRISAVTLHLPIMKDVEGDASGDLPGWMPLELYVVLLSVFSELLAFTAVGLVAKWGEVFPRWIPFLRGRRVPTPAAVVPAALGATILTALWTWSGIALMLGRNMTGRPLSENDPLNTDTWQGILAVAAYLPLLAWGPLLAAVTVAYYRRRAAARP